MIPHRTIFTKSPLPPKAREIIKFLEIWGYSYDIKPVSAYANPKTQVYDEEGRVMTTLGSKCIEIDSLCDMLTPEDRKVYRETKRRFMFERSLALSE